MNKIVLDWPACVARMQGNASLATEVLTLFVQTLNDEMGKLTQSLKCKDWPKSEGILHKVLGGCGYCRVPEFEARLQALRQQIESKQFDQIEDSFRLLQEAALRVIEQYEKQYQ